MKVSEVDFKCLGCGACCRIKNSEGTATVNFHGKI